MIYIKKSILIFILTLALFSCTNTQETRNSNLTYGMVKENLVKGKTSQTEILQTFGAPNIITKNKSDNEVWSYNKMSVDSSEKSSALWLLLGGTNTNAVTKSSSSFDLVIIFDENDIVKDYSVISSKF